MSSPMSTLSPLFLLLLLSLCIGSSWAEPSFLFHNVELVDVSTGGTLPSDVYITANKISDVTSPVFPPPLSTPSMQVVNATGQWLSPGLVNSHTHFGNLPAINALTAIAHGITLVRDCGAQLSLIIPLRDLWNNHTWFGPHLFSLGNMIDGAPAIWPISRVATTPEEGRAVVREMVAATADGIKTYSMLKKDVFAAIIDEGHKFDKLVAGHIPYSASVFDALALGMNGVEHLENFGPAIAELAGVPVEYSVPLGKDIRQVEAEAIGLWKHYASLDSSIIQSFAEKIASAQMFQVPTFVVLDSLTLTQPPHYQDDRLSYIPAFIKDEWARGVTFPKAGLNNSVILALPFMEDFVLRLFEAGAKVLPGTDLGNAYIFPGFSLHDELNFFERAGVRSPAILRAATLDAANAMRLGHLYGDTQVGHRASLVLLDQNPLLDVKVMTSPAAVMLDGMYLNRQRLDELLATVKAKAATCTAYPCI
eukprot:TRINITY_DN199_c0_g1_i1.p1 TRINITY_DN199_c0_g1~~TRINITY_DN199_c0_g1_i1.p1  ORF type:complete len:488 (+),score=92.98 TRINITY_DN199_c0_g1_i1:32-1465(+)